MGFNPRARAGRDGQTRKRNLPSGRFQSTRPRGARPATLKANWQRKEVSIHAPARGATGYWVHLGEGFANVSIHAPARGATWKEGAGHYFCMVSIHAPARGATRRWPRRCSESGCFNPRARAGRDQGRRRHPEGIKRFNPRARAGRDMPSS